MQLPTPACVISPLLYFFSPLIYFPLQHELGKAENFCFSVVSWSIPSVPNNQDFPEQAPPKYLLSELVVLSSMAVFSLSWWSCLPCVQTLSARLEVPGMLGHYLPDGGQGAGSCPRGADNPLKSSDPPERTGTGVLKCEGSLGSSGAWGKLRPRVEERLGPVTKPIGGKARASGDSDSGLSLGLSHAYVKGPSPGSQLQDWA